VYIRDDCLSEGSLLLSLAYYLRIVQSTSGLLCILYVPSHRTVESLETLRAQARAGDPDLKLEDGLLLYRDKLIVPDTNNLRTDLIREAHEQVSTAHPGRTKTI
jgi:hypothetical protein